MVGTAAPATESPVEPALDDDTGPSAEPPRRTRWPYAVAGPLYLGLAVWLWWGVWSTHPTTTGSCGCGDPSLFTWFLEWPAYALRHGQNPLHSTALFHPSGINLLSNTSVLVIGVVLAPVTWLFGPVATLNVALTLAPALSALGAFWLIRRWVAFAPAAFVGALVFGFSPFVISDLAVAHLMTATLVMVPLWVGALDELLLRQRRSPLWMGVGLGVVGAVEFFISTEMTVILTLCTLLGLALLVGHGLVVDRGALARHARHAAPGVGLAALVFVVLCAYPAWYALAGPSHLPGLVWPAIPYFGGFVVKSFFSAPTRHSTLLELGGYFGHPLPSPAYVGWSVVAVLAAGLVAFRRDRRLWFFAAMIFLTAALSLGRGRHPSRSWVPWDLFVHLSVLENVIEQRFVLIMYLAIGAMLAIVIDRVRFASWPAPGVRRARHASGEARASPGSRVLHWVAAAAVAAAALVPMALPFVPDLPYATRAITLPPWFTRVGAHLSPRAVVLTYPPPFSGIQSSMTWQAVDRMQFDQAGGGGPQGTPARAGRQRPGFKVLARLGFGFGRAPQGTPVEIAAVRAALADWGVTVVAVPRLEHTSALFAGDDAAYDAAFMTAAIGRRPRIEDRAWVWYGVDRPVAPLRVAAGELDTCDPVLPGHRHRPMAAVTDCVYALSTRAPPAPHSP
jgi:hypothetical protein